MTIQIGVAAASASDRDDPRDGVTRDCSGADAASSWQLRNWAIMLIWHAKPNFRDVSRAPWRRIDWRNCDSAGTGVREQRPERLRRSDADV